MAKILIVGCGAIGTELASELINKGHHVTGLKRHPPNDEDSAISYFAADIASSDLSTLDKDFEHVFFIVSPDQRNETAYRAVYEAGLDQLLAHFSQQPCSPHWIFVSSTSVYGQTQGEWVDEDANAEPDNITAQLIRSAELKLMFSAQCTYTIVRFSGIYGPGREWLIRKTQQTPSIQKHPPYYTNRIHQQDCIGILVFLFDQQLKGVSLEQCYLATDDAPDSLWNVISWLAEHLRVTQPFEKTAEADASMNKRCSNNKIKALGYQFKYPTYKEGYAAINH